MIRGSITRLARFDTPAPPPSPVTIIDVTSNGDDSVTVTFSGPITQNGDTPPFEIDCGGGGFILPTFGGAAGPESWTGHYAVNPLPGDAWQLNSDPAPSWSAAGGIVFPESGAVA